MHIIEVARNSEAEARSFLDALYYSDFVSVIGFRPQGENFIAVAVNWNGAEETEPDERISRLTTTALAAGKDLDEITAYRRLFPETVFYRPEWNCLDES